MNRSLSITGSALTAMALAVGLLRQGAFQFPIQVFAAAFLAAALVLAVIARRVTAVPWLPVTAAAALAGWALADAALHGPVTGGAGYALLAPGTAAALVTGRSAGRTGRNIIVSSLTGVGVLTALNGWVSVALHLRPGAMTSQGLWRASSFLTYPNATAAVLAILALLVLARLTAQPRSAGLGLAAVVLLAGAGTADSRAGLLALAGGIVALALIQGPRRLLRAALPAALGALAALTGLLPSLPATAPARPCLAAGALAAGLAIAVTLARLPWQASGLTAALAAAAIWLRPAGFGHATRAVLHARGNLASPYRVQAWRIAWKEIQLSPVTGSGPARLRLEWTTRSGARYVMRFVHNEYLQLTAELGLVGLALLALLLASAAWLLYRARGLAEPALWAGTTAGAVTFLIHSSFDFLWHLPVIPLMVAVLAGMATAGSAQDGDQDHRLEHPDAERATGPVNAHSAFP